MGDAGRDKNKVLGEHGQKKLSNADEDSGEGFTKEITFEEKEEMSPGGRELLRDRNSMRTRMGFWSG